MSRRAVGHPVRCVACVGALLALALLGGSAAEGSLSAGGIVFASDRDGDWEIYAIGVDGRGLAQLTRNRVDDGSPVPSPDGSRIVFSRGFDLWVMRRDGSGQRRLARQARAPTWSPDGRRLAFDSWRSGASGLAVAAVEGGPVRVLRRGRPTAPAWSPRGDRILFGARGSLYTVRPDGGGLRRVAGASVGYGDDWAWSPDGSRIAYAQASGALLVSSFDGRRRTQVSPAALRRAGSPAWSPDGRRIAFVASARGPAGIHVVRAGGGGATRLAAADTELGAPAWTADGRALAFTRGGPSHVDGAADLVLAPVSGRPMRMLLFAYPHGGAALPRRLAGPLPRRAVQAPPARPSAQGGVLRAKSRVTAVSADGRRVAVTFAGRRDDCLPPLVVWEPGRPVTPLGARARCPAVHWRGTATLAGDRVALVSGDGGINTEVSLGVAALARPRFSLRASAVHQDGVGGTYLGNLRGDGGLLAFNAWEACRDRGEDRENPDGCDPTFDVGPDSTWLLGAGTQRCPHAHLGGASECRRLRASRFGEELVALDAGRAVLVRDEDALVVSRDGSVSATITPPENTRILTARIHGDDLVLLRTTVLGAHVLAVRSASGAMRTTRPLHGADSAAGDALCGRRPSCADAELRLADLHDGIVLYLHGRNVHLLRLADGRDVRITPPGSGRVHAELDDAGLFYSYTVAGHWPGRVQFRSWDEVRALFP